MSVLSRRRRLDRGLVGLLTLACFLPGLLAPHADADRSGHHEAVIHLIESAAVHHGDEAHFEATAGLHAEQCGACLAAARKVAAGTPQLLTTAVVTASPAEATAAERSPRPAAVAIAPGRAPPTA